MTSSNPFWRTYLFMLASSLLTGMIMMYLQCQDAYEDARTELTYANQIVSTSMHSLLQKNATLLDLMGQRMMELQPSFRSKEARQMLIEMMDRSPELAGLGVIDKDGNFLVSSFREEENLQLPNLLEQEGSAETFRQALKSTSLSVGRTYYIEALKEWTIPIRLRITNQHEEPVAIISAGFKLDVAGGLWSNNNLPEHMRLVIVRTDRYHQYVSGVQGKNYARWYNDPTPVEQQELLERLLVFQTGKTLDDIKQSGEVVTLILLGIAGELRLAAIQYDQTYDNYTSVSIAFLTLLERLAPSFTWIVVLLLLFNIASFFIFRFNAKIQQESKRHLQFQASHDALTQLPNRRFLFNNFLQWQKQQDGHFSLIFIDLDNFKTCNDLHGHSAGDKVLCEVAKRVEASFVQCMNIRQGGDEFIVVTKTIAEEELTSLCSRFLTELNRPIVMDDLDFSIRASIGIAHYPEHGEKIDELLSKADMAMYEAKRLRSQVYIYSKLLAQKNERAAVIEKYLNHALEREELSLVYQPQFNVKTQRVIGIEALVRWYNPTLGENISPKEFIPISEATGHIFEIGFFVINTAIKEIEAVFKRLQAKNPQHFDDAWQIRLSINVSVRQLFSQKFLNHFAQLMQHYDHINISLMIEVTESVLIEDVEKAKSLLESIQQAGIEISLDDFGTGYSSLSHLSKLPINEIKIDRSFVRDILTDNQGWLLIQSIISLGKNLGIPVLAEGVETKQQMQKLAQSGCELFQGYYFSRPLDQHKLEEYLEQQAKTDQNKHDTPDASLNTPRKLHGVNVTTS